ncbi:DNA-binding MarR family transcriptional regulator [Pantoea dispersa]|nr:DNA-binding MarR family transcriptional regulator [Pantoea dispersa]
MSHQQDPRADQRYDYTEQVGHLLRKVYQRHAAIFQQHVGDSQITAVQFITLCALRDRGPSAQNDLVRYTAVDQATIRGVVERLKARESGQSGSRSHRQTQSDCHADRCRPPPD